MKVGERYKIKESLLSIAEIIPDKNNFTMAKIVLFDDNFWKRYLKQEFMLISCVWVLLKGQEKPENIC